MSILSKKSSELTAPREFRGRIAAGSRLRARLTARTIWNHRCANDWLQLALMKCGRQVLPATPATSWGVVPRNPLSEDHVALRPSLLPGLLGVLDHNIRAGAERVAIFETGRVFEPPSGAEQKRVAILLWGNVGGEVHWRNEKRRVDFFDLKGAIELARTGLSF